MGFMPDTVNLIVICDRAISGKNIKYLFPLTVGEIVSFHSFGYDPLKCHNCGSKMLFQELYFNHKPVSLHELYEKVMRKHMCRSPA